MGPGGLIRRGAIEHVLVNEKETTIKQSQKPDDKRSHYVALEKSFRKCKVSLSLSLHTYSQRDKHALGIARSLVEYFSSLDTFNFYSNTRRVLNFLLLFVIQLKRGKFELFFMKPSGECEAAGEAQWTQVDNKVFVPGLVHTRKQSQERCRKHNRNSLCSDFISLHTDTQPRA